MLRFNKTLMFIGIYPSCEKPTKSRAVMPGSKDSSSEFLEVKKSRRSTTHDSSLWFLSYLAKFVNSISYNDDQQNVYASSPNWNEIGTFPSPQFHQDRVSATVTLGGSGGLSMFTVEPLILGNRFSNPMPRDVEFFSLET